MNQGDTNRPPRPHRRKPPVSRGARQATAMLATLGLVVVLVLVLSLVAYAARREIARQALVSWLESHGVQAEVNFERFDPNGLIASIRAGDPDDPDLTVERAEVDYELGMPWSGGFSVRPTRVRLVRPEVHASLVDGRLSLGALGPIIEDFTSRPPSPDRTSPTILIEDGRFRLQTRGGRLIAMASARLENNRLIRLDAAIPGARLRDGETALDLDRAGVAVRTIGDRLALAVTAHADQIAGAGLSGQDGLARLVVEGPYPETARRRVHGPVQARLRGGFAQAGWQVGQASGLNVDLSFDGQGTGWIEAFALLGGLSGQVTADRLSAADAQFTRAALVLEGEQVRFSRRDEVRWRYEGDARISTAALERGGLSALAVNLRLVDLTAGGSGEAAEARGRLDVDASRLAQDSLSLTGVAGTFDLVSRLSGAGLTTLSGSLQSSGGAWPLLGTPGPGDVPEQAALKRAFGAFALSAPGLLIRTGSPRTEVSLTHPARIRPLSGGEIVITPRQGQALYAAQPGASGQGGLLIQASGGGLPEARIDVPRYVMGDDGLVATLDGEADFDFGLARGARIQTTGMLRVADGRTTFTAARCFPFSAALLELGENDVGDLSTQLCPVQAPLISIADGWRFEAEARDLAATAPFLGMAITDARARVSARDPGGALAIEAGIADSLISDTEDVARFYPLRGAGRVQLTNEVWSGTLSLRDRAHGRRIADVGIRHDGRSGVGGVQFDARGLTFAPGGLQPGQISPLAARAMGDAVTGAADFTGVFDWTTEGATSQGRFSTPGLDFVSPLGAVTQLSGDIEFLSLTPLVTAPDQHFRAQRVEAFLPLTDVDIGVGLTGSSVRVSGGRIAVAGGFVRLEPADIPLDPEQPWEGVLILEQVQLGELFIRSSFAEAVQLDAVVSGRVPFIFGPNGVTIVEGDVSAVQPGRLSIAREALSGMSAGGGGEQVPPNTVQDFAYQAMENLWFDQLDAQLNSLPQGRLGVLFSIHGRHDPPVEQQLQLGVVELIRRDFLNRILPLPSGTEINLTLDTSFNLDQLIEDLMEIQRARSAGESNP